MGGQCRGLFRGTAHRGEEPEARLPLGTRRRATSRTRWVREPPELRTLRSTSHNQVVGEFEDQNQNIHAFSWKDGSLTSLEAMGGPDSHAFTVNDRGLIVGYASDRNHQFHALLWHSEKSKPVVLKPLDQCPHAQALGVNAEGWAVGSSYTSKMGQAVVWKTPDEPQELPVPSPTGEAKGRSIPEPRHGGQ